ncbi:ATP-binding protein [Nostoc sp.]|uniref:ATP-binding protein n=1 Tax=Nostoc sp. TaxID=1180 RepID=UPI002FF47FBE
MSIDLVFNAIKAIAPATFFPLINLAQSQEYVIDNLQKLGLAKIQPGGKFEEVYGYALVDYKKSNSESTLNFFRNKENKAAFWKAFVALSDEEWDILKAKAQKAQIDWVRVEDFYQVFIKVANRSNNPGQVIVNAQNQEAVKAQNQETVNLLREILAVLKKRPEAIAKSQSKEPVKDLPYPDDFKALIEDKTKAFCGREFVFNEFDNFLKNHRKGYFTVIGDPGMGKSAIAAEYVSRSKAICYFNIQAQSPNTPEQFLQSIRQQLINRYQLQDAENDNLSTLLTKVNQKLVADKPLVIVVDALDEVDQQDSGNILYLPTNLPERIYFMLTRRPYASNKKRLLTDGVTQQELDLTAKQYEDFNRADVKNYISFCINDDPEYKDGLQKWITNRYLSNVQKFIDELVIKSENNFMYLRYVLPDIAKEIDNDLTIDKLPQGLKDYYQWHWRRMGMDETPQELTVIILFILVQLTTSPTLNMIAEYADVEEYEVEKVLDEWVEYLRKQQIQGQLCYSIYHTSFLDFLKAQRELQPTRRLFQWVVQRIYECLYSEKR